MARTPLYNGLMQSDLDANGFRIINLGGAGNVQSGTVYVDPEAEPGTGEIDSTAPFDNLEDALAAAPAGYNIIMRPAVYRFDGQLDVSRQVTIIGYGATIAPATPGEMCGLGISADGVSIFGLSFDGELAPGDTVDAQAGVLEISATVCYLKFIYIADQHGVGIKLIDRFSNFVLEESLIARCYRGILGDVTTTSVDSVTIRNNTIKECREGGIVFNGVNNVGGVALTTLDISDNEIAVNDTDGAQRAGINITGGAVYFQINDNFVYSHYRNIIVEKAKYGTISNNHLSDATQEHIRFGSGHQNVSIIGNIIDCSNPANGAPMSLGGINVLGNYAVSNDSGPLLISGNQITDVDATNGFSIKLANTNYTTIVGNQLQLLEASSYAYLQISANEFIASTDNPPIALYAAERGSSGATIASNRFTVTGSPTRLIATDDTSATGHASIHIMSNSSSPGDTYSQGIVDNVGGDPPTGLYITANTPPSPTGNKIDGWVNDDAFPLVNQVIVSQQRGANGTAIRESDAHPYLSIAAAMADAVSGDTVYVQDGEFDEIISAKNGVTVRFLPGATLNCTTANGCIDSSADGEVFFLYHEHAPIKSSEAGNIAVRLAHDGVYHLHCNIENTGTNTGQLAHAIGVVSGSSAVVHLYGSAYSANGFAVSTLGTGSPLVLCHPVSHPVTGTVSRTPHLYSASSVALGVNRGKIIVDGFWINSNGNVAISIPTATSTQWFKNCTITTTSTGDAAIDITASAPKIVPLFRDCVIVSEDTATQSIDCDAAQDITVMGSVIGNKGADPPTNVTFQGGGTYVVDADAVGDFF